MNSHYEEVLSTAKDVCRRPDSRQRMSIILKSLLESLIAVDVSSMDCIEI